MDHIVGKSVYVEWQDASGTIAMNMDRRSFSVDESMNTADTTAGTDTDQSHIPTTRSTSGSFSFLFSTGTSGIYQSQRIYTGAEGTLYWGYGGTSIANLSGEPKFGKAITITGASYAAEYEGEVTMDVSWEGNGDWIAHGQILGSTWS